MGGDSGVMWDSGIIAAAPLIYSVEPFTNDDEVDLSGLCEPFAEVTIYCNSDVYVTSCSGPGTFTVNNVDLYRGSDTTCHATASNLGGSVSADSNYVSSMACAVEDIFDSNMEGNTAADAAPNDYLDAAGHWGGSLQDDGLVVLTHSGTLLNGDSDWIVVDLADDVTADDNTGIDIFNAKFMLTDSDATDAIDEFTLKVYRGSYTNIQECDTNSLGYTEYNFCNDGSNPDGFSFGGTQLQCGPNNPEANPCTDYSSTFWIHIERASGIPTSCNSYMLTMTNGVWTDGTEHQCQYAPTPSTPPSLTLISPSDNDIYSQDDWIVFEAQVSDAEDLPEDLSLSWSSNIDGVFDTGAAGSNGIRQFSWSSLSAGSHLVTLTVTDTYGLEVEGFVSFEVVANHPPSVSAVSITPDPAVATDTLSCNYSTSDVDGDAVVANIDWSVGGVSVGTGPTLAGVFAKGDTVTCTVTPNDGTEDGAPDSDDIVIGNAPPSVSNVEISPDPATVTDTLSCAYTFTDADGDADTSSIDWSVGGTTVGSGSTLSGAFAKGETVTCTVTPNDSTDAGTPDSDDIVIGNTAPSVSDVLISPDPAYVTDTLSCAYTFTDADGDADTSSIDWSVGGTTVGSGSTLSGAFAKGETVTCTVTPNDSTDAGTPDSDDIVIGNTAPSVSDVLISPDPAYVTDTLSCGYTFADADGDSVASTIDWTVGGTSVGTGPTLSGAFTGGETVTCTVTPDDGTDAGTPDSDDIVIGNTPPEVTNVAISPAPADTFDDLTMTYTYSDADSDGDSSSIVWEVDSVVVSGVTGPTLDFIHTAPGAEVTVTVTPDDGTDTGTPVADTLFIDDYASCGGGITGLPIATCEQLEEMALDLTETYCLINDVDCSGISDFATVANTGSDFSGSFYGAGYTISDLATSGRGLFGTVSGALDAVVLNNVVVANTVTSGSTGGVVGEYIGSSDLDGMVVSGSVSSSVGTPGVGGIVGIVGSQNQALLNSSFTGTVTGSSNTGGLVGEMSSGADGIMDSWVNADVTGSDGYTGGAAGRMESITGVPGVVSNVSVSGTVSGTYSVGGLAGKGSADFANCSSTAVVSGSGSYIGGLIGVLAGEATVVDSTASGAVTGGSSPATGGLVGHMSADSSVSQSSAYGAVSSSSYMNGGLVGRLDSGSLVDDCQAYGDVTSTEHMSGGLVGWMSSATVQDSTAWGTVDAEYEVGGLVGSTTSGTVLRSAANGDINSGGGDAGGLIGKVDGGGLINQCSAMGTVTSTYGTHVGGLVGGLNNSAVEQSVAMGTVSGQMGTTGGLVGWAYAGDVQDSYALGAVYGTLDNTNGGLVGASEELTTVTSSYSSGSVSSSSTPGGLVGSTQAGDVYTNAYWDTESSGNSQSAAGTGKTTAQMIQASTFSAWDFSAVWTITDGTTYPCLQWQGTPCPTPPNLPPTVSAVSITPNPAFATDTLTCNYTYYDPEGDADNSSVAWSVGGVSAGSGTTLVGGFVGGDTVACTVTPNDGNLGGTPVSGAIIIGNNAPTAPVISIAPATPTAGESLLCSVDQASTDADGDSVTYNFNWTYDDGQGSSGTASGAMLTTTVYTDDTVMAGETQVDETWTCTVTPNDGTEDGDSASTSIVVEGEVCSSLEFDGNDIVTIDGGVPAALAGTNSTKMLAAWVWRDANANGYEVATLNKYGSDCGNTSCGGEKLKLFAGTDVMGIMVGQGNYTLATPLPMNEWVYIFGGYDSATGGYFVGFVHSGVLTIENPGTVNGISRSVITGGSQLLFGNSNHEEYFEGLIDRVEIWTIRPSDADLVAWAQEEVDPTRPGLYAAWNLDEQSGTTVTDEVSGWTGTNSGATWSSECAGDTSPHEICTSLEFDGDDIVTAGNTPSAVLGSAPKWVGGWVYPSGSTGTQALMVVGSDTSGGSPPGGQRFEFSIIGGTGELLINVNQISDSTLSIAAPQGQWSYVFGYWDGTDYFAGMVSAGAVITETLTLHSQQLSNGTVTVGSYLNKYGYHERFLNGRLSELQLRSSIPTEAEIIAMAEGSLAPDEFSGLELYWPLDEGSGSTASGTGPDLSIGTATWSTTCSN
jgi:hypothetical protein